MSPPCPALRLSRSLRSFCFYAPIITLVIYSFNGGDSVNQWGGFSLEWYAVAAKNEAVQDATAPVPDHRGLGFRHLDHRGDDGSIGYHQTGQVHGANDDLCDHQTNRDGARNRTAVALLIFFSSVKVATGYTGLGYLILAHRPFVFHLPICRSRPGSRGWTRRWKPLPPIFMRHLADLPICHAAAVAAGGHRGAQCWRLSSRLITSSSPNL